MVAAAAVGVVVWLATAALRVRTEPIRIAGAVQPRMSGE
jgi:hypothetical protein